MTKDSMNKGTKTIKSCRQQRSRARVDCPADLPCSELYPYDLDWVEPYPSKNFF